MLGLVVAKTTRPLFSLQRDPFCVTKKKKKGHKSGSSAEPVRQSGSPSEITRLPDAVWIQHAPSGCISSHPSAWTHCWRCGKGLRAASNPRSAPDNKLSNNKLALHVCCLSFVHLCSPVPATGGQTAERAGLPMWNPFS